MANYGMITEQGDLGLGFDPLNQKDNETVNEAVEREKENKNETVINENKNK